MKLYKKYYDEDKAFETTLENEREILEDWFKDVDLLASELYTIFDEIPEGTHSFRTTSANYYWIK